MLCLVLISISISILSVSTQEDDDTIFFTDSTVFMEVVQRPTYADKTAMLGHVFSGAKHKLLSAPRRFFKSTHLDMVKTFASIPVTKRGETLDANLTEAHDVFSALQVGQDRLTFTEHFGKYPILHVDFKSDQPVSGQDDLVDILRRKVHHSYKQHRYLLSSDKLTDQERQAIRVWGGNNVHKSLDKYDVKYGLSDLAAGLYKHYQTKILVLVDEYDSLISDAMIRLNDQELRDVVSTVTEQITILLTHIYVQRTLITGVSSISLGLPDLEVQTFRFLDDHQFVDYYGYTKPEIDNLFQKRLFKLDNDAIRDAHDKYGAYTSKTGSKIYSPFPVLNFLQTGQVRNYWSQSEGVEALKAPVVREQILKMMKESIPIEIVRNVSLSEVLRLRKPVLREQTDDTVNLFLTYLLEQGYLCYDEKCKTCVKLANREIEDEVRRVIK